MADSAAYQEENLKIRAQKSIEDLSSTDATVSVDDDDEYRALGGGAATEVGGVSVQVGEKAGAQDEEDAPFRFSWRKLWRYTGPGWLMSIAYLDPGNLESDLQAGAFTGYQLIWVLLLATILGLFLQILAVRLGVVTGKSLAEACREGYPRRVSFLLWIMTELAIIGSDIQEVIGSAIAFKILAGLPLWAGALITGADTFTFLGLHAFGVRKLEAMFAILIGTMTVCFFVDFGYSAPNAGDVLRGFVPGVSSYAVVQAVGILGAVIMPHNIYLHSALVQSRRVDRNRPAKVREANAYFSIEATVALAVSFLVNLAVVAVFANGFFDEGCAQNKQAMVDGQCADIGLMEAGDALHDVLGKSARSIWAIGLLAAGQSSTMTGTYAGQFVMEGFLKLQISPWKRVLLTRSIALIPALIIAIASESRPEAADVLDEWLNILQSIQLPFALFPILHFTSSKRLMGRFVNGGFVQFGVWVIAVFACAVNVFLIANFVTDDDAPTPHEWWFFLIVIVIAIFYFIFIFTIIKEDFNRLQRWVRQRFFGAILEPETEDEHAPVVSGVAAAGALVSPAAEQPAAAAAAAAPSYSTFVPPR